MAKEYTDPGGVGRPSEGTSWGGDRGGGPSWEASRCWPPKAYQAPQISYEHPLEDPPEDVLSLKECFRGEDPPENPLKNAYGIS